MNEDIATMATTPNNDRSSNADIVSSRWPACRYYGVGVYRILWHITPWNHHDLIPLYWVVICKMFFVPSKSMSDHETCLAAFIFVVFDQLDQ